MIVLTTGFVASACGAARDRERHRIPLHAVPAIAQERHPHLSPTLPPPPSAAATPRPPPTTMTATTPPPPYAPILLIPVTTACSGNPTALPL
ncbi:hypothetical protein K525DRAFT_275289 [Schizophyllum commune Loenen D]|nr:hypothetical protein K525DRAFT_275289 [Schizophyllum commune Loenen D]